MAGIKALAFDKDGTLFDFNGTWGAWLKGFLHQECGGDARVVAEVAGHLGYDPQSETFHPSSLVIAGTTEEVCTALCAVLPRAEPEALYQRIMTTTAMAPQVEVIPLVPFLEGLRARGLTLGVVTNDAEAPARGNLASVGAETLFDQILGYDSGYGGKPAPGQLLAFAKAQGVAPSSCAMVGDSLHDLHAARAAGFLAIGVLTGVADRAELAPAADVVLPSIAALPAWLDR